jgi:hypothetical protein
MSCGLHVILRTVNLGYHSLVITVHENSGIDFSTISKSIRRSRSHLALDLTVSNAVSSAFIVDFVMTVCLQDF